MLKTPHSFLEYTWFIIIFLYSWIQFAGICLTFLYLYSWERSICNFLAVILCGFNTNFLVYLKFLVKLQELLLANGKLQWKFRLLSFIIMALIPPWGSTFMTYCCCCCSVTKSILCDPMDCSTPGLPVTHHLPEFGQVHAHWVGDAIKPSHPLLPSSPPAFNLSQH